MCAGQFLDIVSSRRKTRSCALARKISLLKSAKYTIERPLQIGVALRGDDPTVMPWLRRFGLALGEAFQLVDDTLGIFGTPEQTGKPVGDDLREGKLTLLVATAWREATPAGRSLLERVGDPQLSDRDVEALQRVIRGSGALALAHNELDRLVRRARSALNGCELTSDARSALRALTDFVVNRDS